jgi:hypothetical protein
LFNKNKGVVKLRKKGVRNFGKNSLKYREIYFILSFSPFLPTPIPNKLLGSPYLHCPRVP